MMFMSHLRSSRQQRSKYHIRQRVRHLHHAATLAATVTAVAVPASRARAGDSSPRTHYQRITVPPMPSVQSSLSPTKAEAHKNQLRKSKVSRHKPQTSLIATSGVASAVARSHYLADSHSIEAPSLPVLATRPEKANGAVRVAEASTPAATAPSPPASNPTSADNRVLLAQLDAELRETQAKLESTDEKLSAGQRQLLGLSNTLRSVMLQDGENAAGLHPFVRVASRYAGTPYVWGGESRYGFDCSGFIIRVMRDLGYHALPHSAAEQFKYGQPVAQALLKPGDLVFFANTYKPGISHVGIYIGKRRFIHAASTRQGTIISSLDSQPYCRKYAGARRLLAAQKP
jgi:cell wall-associated NlpC family hydrolase